MFKRRQIQTDSTDRPKPRNSGDEYRQYRQSTFLFSRLLGLTFLIAFISFHVQMEGLIGEVGILPAFERMEAWDAQDLQAIEMPTMGWLTGARNGALTLWLIAGELASFCLLLGLVPGPACLLATLMYLSLLNVSGPFIALQWDTLLIELGWLSSVGLPWRWTFRNANSHMLSPLIRWGVWLLLFRVLFLSGIVKLNSGDPHWANLSALGFHYWTQPLPNALSFFAHQLPPGVHRIATFMVLLLELGLPLLIFFGDRGRRIAFVGGAVLMLSIALTGNYGFFQGLMFTMLVTLLDDAWFKSPWLQRFKIRLFAQHEPPDHRSTKRRRASVWAIGLPLVLAGQLQLVEALGFHHLPETISEFQNHTYRYHFAHRYGLFAVMTTSRREIIFEGSHDGRRWQPYVFRYKPQDPLALPSWSTPHMPRLDWMLWFASLSPPNQTPWVRQVAIRLLEGRPSVHELLEPSPFSVRPPRWVRARLVDYAFTNLDTYTTHGRVWRTEDLGLFLAPMTRR